MRQGECSPEAHPKGHLCKVGTAGASCPEAAKAEGAVVGRTTADQALGLLCFRGEASRKEVSTRIETTGQVTSGGVLGRQELTHRGRAGNRR